MKERYVKTESELTMLHLRILKTHHCFINKQKNAVKKLTEII